MNIFIEGLDEYHFVVCDYPLCYKVKYNEIKSNIPKLCDDIQRNLNIQGKYDDVCVIIEESFNYHNYINIEQALDFELELTAKLKLHHKR